MKDPNPAPPNTIPERDFEHASDARRILKSRIDAAKKAFAQDTETADGSGLNHSQMRPSVLHLEASKVFRRACLWAFYEYVHATTVYASKEQGARARQALENLAERMQVQDAHREAEAERRYGLEPGDLSGFHA